MLVAPRTARVPLLPGDFEERIRDLAARIDQVAAEAKSDKRKRAAAMKLAQELDRLKDTPELEGGLVLELREVPQRREDQILDEHPARKGNTKDMVAGYNTDTFPGALLRATLVAVHRDGQAHEVSDTQFAEWLASVSPANWEKAWNATRHVQHGEVSVPKSSAVSVLRASLADD